MDDKALLTCFTQFMHIMPSIVTVLFIVFISSFLTLFILKALLSTKIDETDIVAAPIIGFKARPRDL